MRTRLLPLLALTVPLVLGACGDDEVDAGATDGPAGGVTAVAPLDPDTPVSSPPDDGSGTGDVNPGAPAPRIVEPTPGLLNPIPSAIESYASIDDDTVELRYYTGVAECYGLDRIDVEEADESVTVTVFTGGRPDAEVCIEIAEQVVTKVTLGAPLGDRQLIDGSTGQPVPVD